MESIYALLRRYPNRIKYGIVILDVFAMIIAIRTYVNYVSIETAIEDATIQKQIKTDELAFTQNFLVNYEKSEYAKYFLEHENNMLLSNEYIVKFEEMYQKHIVFMRSEEHTSELQSPDHIVCRLLLEKK